MCKKLLLLSELRCGGTNLVRTIAGHPEIRYRNVVDECQELLCTEYTYKGVKLPTTQDEWHLIFGNWWAERDIWHLQRSNLPVEGGGWEALMAHTPRVICLHRWDKMAQFLSWRYGMLTGQWHTPDRRPLPRAWWGGDALFRQMTGEWEAAKQRAEVLLPDALWVAYEELEDNWGETITRCLAHLGLSPLVLPPAMVRPNPIDYFGMFDMGAGD